MDEQERFAQKKAASRDFFSGEKCAIVAPTDLGFALARIHVSLGERAGIDTKAFKDYNEALIWLGVELDDEKLIRG